MVVVLQGVGEDKSQVCNDFANGDVTSVFQFVVTKVPCNRLFDEGYTRDDGVRSATLRMYKQEDTTNTTHQCNLGESSFEQRIPCVCCQTYDEET